MTAPSSKPINDMAVFDRDRVRANRDRAASFMMDGHNFLHNHAMAVLADRIMDVKRTFDTVIQIGAGPSIDALDAPIQAGRMASPFIADLSPGFLNNHSGPRVQMDEEFLPLASETLDLILAPLGLHAVNDLPGALLQIRKSLKPDGLFLGAMLGGETLYELRACLQDAEMATRGGISPRIAPFADKPQMGGLLQRAGFALPVVDSEIITVTYSDMFALMRDIRKMGEGNAIARRDTRNPGRTMMMEAAKLYAERFADPDGRIRASFEIIYLIGWSPHDSQQKPLRPGSAKIRLADALSTKEIGAGEPTPTS